MHRDVGQHRDVMIGSRRGEFHLAGSAAARCENRKPVRPDTRTLSTTPTMIWLTTYLMLNTASTIDTRAPATAAASRPTKALSVRVGRRSRR